MSKLFKTPLFKRGKGFTLIELLIVIAIILILIAIALPNFLEAQERARVARGKAHLRTMETGIYSFFTQYGFLYADFNDPTLTTQKTRNRSSGFSVMPCGINPPVIRSNGGIRFNIVSQGTFYAPNVHCPLTSPIKFIDAAATVDPWSDGSVPVGMDSRYDCPTGCDAPKWIRYSVYFIAGPDKIAGQWLRGHGADGGCPAALFGNRGTEYSPTNGTQSCGELWMVIANDTAFAKNEYQPLKSF